MNQYIQKDYRLIVLDTDIAFQKDPRDLFRKFSRCLDFITSPAYQFGYTVNK